METFLDFAPLVLISGLMLWVHASFLRSLERDTELAEQLTSIDRQLTFWLKGEIGKLTDELLPKPTGLGVGRTYRDQHGNYWVVVDRSDGHGLCFRAVLIQTSTPGDRPPPGAMPDLWFEPDGTMVESEDESSMQYRMRGTTILQVPALTEYDAETTEEEAPDA